MLQRVNIRLLSLAMILTLVSNGIGAQFYRMGDLPGGNDESSVTSMSADGRVVVGQSHIGTHTWSFGGLFEQTSNVYRSFRWTPDAGVQDLGVPEDNFTAERPLVSADGSVITGVVKSSKDLDIIRPLRGLFENVFSWTEQGGFHDVGHLESPTDWQIARPSAISSDGRIIMGSSAVDNEPDYGSRDHIFRWEADGEIIDLGGGDAAFASSPTYPGGSVSGMTGDGSIAVGRSSGCSDCPSVAWIWNEVDGFQNASTVLGIDVDRLSGISASGDVIIGTNTDGEGFIWRESDAVAYPGRDDPRVTVGGILDPNGSLLSARITETDGTRISAVWSEERGIVDIDSFLEDFGVGTELTGWAQLSLVAASSDGNVIAGNGTNPDGSREGWVAVRAVPEPGSGLLLSMAIVSIVAIRRYRRSLSPPGRTCDQ